MKNDPPSDDAAKNYRRRRRLIRIGQALMVLGVLVAGSHWIAHLAPNGGQGPSIGADIFLGYPTGGLLIVVGAIMAGQTSSGKR